MRSDRFLWPLDHLGEQLLAKAESLEIKLVKIECDGEQQILASWELRGSDRVDLDDGQAGLAQKILADFLARGKGGGK
jgi:hypothetical protein